MDSIINKRYTPRRAEALLARVVDFAEAPICSGSQKQTVRLLHEVSRSGPMLLTGVPAISSWTAHDLAGFQRTIQIFFRRLIEASESGKGGIEMPQLVVERLRFGITTVRDDVALTVEGHGAADVLTLQILNLVQMVGLDRLRRCACGRVFAKTGRREFCSDRCQKRFYMRARRKQERERPLRRAAGRRTSSV